ncbi:MAG: RagB/SusD family nutrient uptake outer membrane protein [Mucilaginibacter sp.]
MKRFFLIMLISAGLPGCQKYLDEKPNKALALPADNIDNLKLLIEDTNTMNQQVASAGEVGTDNFYLTDAEFQKLSGASVTSANLYVWNSNVFNDNDRNDWTLTYKVVLNANLVLDALKTLKPTPQTQEEWNNVKGEALFFRAWSFLQLLQEFSKAYNAGTAAADLGIALRLTPDVNVASKRASVKDSYAQVISDLQAAVPLLPQTPDFKTTPGKLAALGLLARTHLLMGNYDQALSYANQYLAISPGLIDFNTLSPSAAYPIARYNTEVAFHATLFQLSAYGTSYGRVSDSLYADYKGNDLRKTLFFKNSGPGNIIFKGSYDGSRTAFGGIATDEMYLTAAECYARGGQVSNAMTALNTLLANRWQTGTFIPYAAADANSAILLILAERRKELVFRNLRWADIKRLNNEGTYPVSIVRNVAGQTYSLPPNDLHYVLPLPVKVVQLSGMQQN